MLHLPPAVPAATSQDLERLRQGFADQEVPSKKLDHNLLIATWNLRAFGGLTQKWQSGPGDSPLRDLHSLAVIAEIVSHFDVVAIQEARETLAALRHMLKMLGPEWGLILTDVNQGDRGNGERMAFVFDTRRVKPSGLAGELVVYVDPGQDETADPTGSARAVRSLSLRGQLHLRHPDLHPRHASRRLGRRAGRSPARAAGESPTGWPTGPPAPATSTTRT